VLRNIQQFGDDKGIVLTREMLEHLGVTETVDVSFEDGRIVLAAPREAAAPRRRQSFREAADATLEQYDEALKELAKS
jgi:antitoxin component of MazEF toxin-antitoxin module